MARTINPDGKGSTTRRRPRASIPAPRSSAQQAFDIGAVVRVIPAVIGGGVTLAATRNPAIAAGVATGILWGSQEPLRENPNSVPRRRRTTPGGR
jgi:hypothetical protein